MARRGAKFGMSAPTLIQFEQEIDKEMLEDVTSPWDDDDEEEEEEEEDEEEEVEEREE